MRLHKLPVFCKFGNNRSLKFSSSAGRLGVKTGKVSMRKFQVCFDLCCDREITKKNLAKIFEQLSICWRLAVSPRYPFVFHTDRHHQHPTIDPYRQTRQVRLEGDGYHQVPIVEQGCLRVPQVYQSGFRQGDRGNASGCTMDAQLSWSQLIKGHNSNERLSWCVVIRQRRIVPLDPIRSAEQ